MSCPLTLLVDQNEEWSQESKLHVSGDCPSPEKASIIRSLEVWINVANHQQLTPPVFITIFKHQVGLIPDRTGAQVREDCPSGEEDEVVHRSESEILSGVEFEAIGDADVPLGLIQRKELVCAQEG